MTSTTPSSSSPPSTRRSRLRRPRRANPPAPLPPDVEEALADGRTASAVTRPPLHSSTRAHRLLTAAVEAGLGSLALSCLQRITLADLDAHDRVTYLRLLHDHVSWLEALHVEAVMAVAGPLDGWVADEVEEILYEAVTGHPLIRRDRAETPPGDEAGCGQDPAATTRRKPAQVPSGGEPGCGLPVDSVAHDAPAGMPSGNALNCGRTIDAPTEVVLVDDEESARSIPKAWEFAEYEGDAWQTREMAAATEVALATTVSKRTAGRRIETARFMHAHPLTLAMARTGRWNYGHLRVCETELAGVEPALIDTVLAEVATLTHREPPSRLAQRIRKSLARHDRAGIPARMRDKRESVEADGWMLPDGQGRIVVTAEHTRISEALDSLNDLADARRAWLRSAGLPVPDASTLRGQLLLAAITTATSSSTDTAMSEGIPAQPLVSAPPGQEPRESARARRRRQQAAIIVDLATALGMSDEPGYLPGYGWVPADIAREIAASTHEWSRWLVDDTSRALLDINNTRYRPTEALRRFINARAQDCTMPVCTRPASEAQLDHADDFDGANTTTANLHPACGPDHLIVTAGYFLVTLDEHGRATWTSTTTGHSYVNPPSPVLEGAPAPIPADAPISPIEAMTHRLLRDAA